MYIVAEMAFTFSFRVSFNIVPTFCFHVVGALQIILW